MPARPLVLADFTQPDVLEVPPCDHRGRRKQGPLLSGPLSVFPKEKKIWLIGFSNQRSVHLFCSLATSGQNRVEEAEAAGQTAEWVPWEALGCAVYVSQHPIVNVSKHGLKNKNVREKKQKQK